MHDDLQIIEWIEAELASDARQEQDEREAAHGSSMRGPEDAGWLRRREELLDAFDRITSLRG